MKSFIPKSFLLSALLLKGTFIHAQGLEWVSSFAGNEQEDGYAISIDPVRNVYTAGIFEDTTDFDPGEGEFFLTSEGQYDFFVSKLDADGNFVWARSFGDISDDVAYDVATDESGNVYITGLFARSVDFDPGPGQYIMESTASRNMFVLKLDTNGDFVWANQSYGETFVEGRGITIDKDGNVYVSGSFQYPTVFIIDGSEVEIDSFHGRDVLVAKLNNAGEFVWVRQMGGQGQERGLSIASDVSNNVFITGYFYETIDFDPGAGSFSSTSNGESDIFVASLDTDGNFLWAAPIGGMEEDEGVDIALDAEGNVYATGYFESHPDFGVPVDFDPGEGEFILVSEGRADNFVLKLDNDGNFIWARQLGGLTTSESFGIAVDNDGNVYTTGYQVGDFDADPGEDEFILDWAGSEDIFISKLDTDGNFVWAVNLGGDFVEEGYAIAVDDDGYVYTTGFFWRETNFDPGSGVFNLDWIGSADVFIHKLNQVVSDVTEFESKSSSALSIYPNPGNGIFTIVNPKSLELNYHVRDITGRLILNGRMNQVQTLFDIAGYQSGMYIIEFYNDETILDRRKVMLR